MSLLHFTEMSAWHSGNVKPMGLVLVGPLLGAFASSDSFTSESCARHSSRIGK